MFRSRTLSTAAVTALIVGALLAPAVQAATVNYASRMLTASEAGKVTKSSKPLGSGMADNAAGRWLRSFTDSSSGAPLPRFTVSVFLNKQTKPMSTKDLTQFTGMQGQASGSGIDCKIIENKPPRFTQVCEMEGTLFASSAIVLPKKFVVVGSSMLLNFPDPTAEDAGAPASFTSADKDRAAADAKALRDAQYQKILKGKI